MSTPPRDPLELRPLIGSERAPAPDDAAPAPALDPNSTVTVTVVLRRKREVPAEVLTARLSAEQFTERYGADPTDVDLVVQTLTGLGATVISADAAQRRIQLSATVVVLSRMFGTELLGATTTAANGRPQAHRLRSGGLSIPAALDGIVTAVLGLDDRPQARTRMRVVAPAAVSTSFTPPQLATIYDFPPDTDGEGQIIAILELGGGFSQTDLDEYFSELQIAVPQVTAIGVDGAENVPGQDPNGADGEVLLDIEVAGALAPAAQLLVYFAPNTDAGFLNALSEATHAQPTPTAISISWGQSEDSWTAQARTAFDQALFDAAALGVTVSAAAGDNGSSDLANSSAATSTEIHADFPASSPHALACGGTRLTANPTTGAVASETVWNNAPDTGATGGGVSRYFPLPTWQRAAGVPAHPVPGGRGIPDVAAVADPQTGYRVRVNGTDLVIGGTSAVAPLWAALVARLVQATGVPLGLIHTELYASTRAGAPTPGFRDITVGNNGEFTAGPGWDACTGLGVPNGVELLAALRKRATPS